MSDFERDIIIGSAPYTCVSCGGPMRTRKADGRCYSCSEPVAQRCEVCNRVRLDVGGDWGSHPAPLPAEVGVVCATCSALQRKQLEKVRDREKRVLVKRMAKGYGPAEDGVDIWK